MRLRHLLAESCLQSTIPDSQVPGEPRLLFPFPTRDKNGLILLRICLPRRMPEFLLKEKTKELVVSVSVAVQTRVVNAATAKQAPVHGFFQAPDKSFLRSSRRELTLGNLSISVWGRKSEAMKLSI